MVALSFTDHRLLRWSFQFVLGAERRLLVCFGTRSLGCASASQETHYQHLEGSARELMYTETSISLTLGFFFLSSLTAFPMNCACPWSSKAAFIGVFTVKCSHADWASQMSSHLLPCVRTGLISVWYCLDLPSWLASVWILFIWVSGPDILKGKDHLSHVYVLSDMCCY